MESKLSNTLILDYSQDIINSAFISIRIYIINIVCDIEVTFFSFLILFSL